VPVPVLAQMQRQSKSAMGWCEGERERKGACSGLGCAPSALRVRRAGRVPRPGAAVRSLSFFIRSGGFFSSVGSSVVQIYLGGCAPLPLMGSHLTVWLAVPARHLPTMAHDGVGSRREVHSAHPT
jgi:hypothetical protein